MGLLNGYSADVNETGSFYGKYSFGNLYDEILSEEHINVAKLLIVMFFPKVFKYCGFKIITPFPNFLNFGLRK